MPKRAEVTVSSITLTASLDESVPEGRPVILTLDLHNGGTELIETGGSASEPSSFQITVTDGAGRLVPRTAAGERVLTPPTAVFRNRIVMIGPNQTRRYRFNLAHLFDLSRAGDYDAGVSRTLVPWHFLVAPSKAGSPEPTMEANLAVGPLRVRMIDAADAASGPTALTLPPGRQTFLYIASRFHPGINRYRVGEDGGLSFAFDPIGNDTFSPAPGTASGTGMGALVTTPDGRYLYASDNEGVVSQFRIGDDGVLFPLSPPTVPAVKRPGRWYTQHPGPLLVDSKGRFLYNLVGALYAIGPDGRLTVLPPSSPDACYTAGSDGRLVSLPRPPFTASYGIGPDGRLTTLSQPLAGPAGPSGGNATATALSPSGRFAFVLTTTSFTKLDDLVVPMRVEPNGALTPLPGAQKPQTPPLPWPGFQPPSCRTLAVDPTGRFLVVVNQSFLDCYRIGPNGSLTSLGMTIVQGNFDSVFFVPSARLVYADNTNPPSLLAFRLDDRRGLIPARLDPPNDVPFDAGIMPVAAVAPTPPKWGPTEGGLEMSARLSADVLPASESVVLTVVLSNVTPLPIQLGWLGADMAAFRLSLIGPQPQSASLLWGNGKRAAVPGLLLAAGQELQDMPVIGGAALVLPAGGQRQYRLVLSRLADLTVAGNYTIRVTRVLSGGATVAAPTLHVRLEGPYSGITEDGNGQGQPVPGG